jgi:hypothetical protein
MYHCAECGKEIIGMAIIINNDGDLACDHKCLRSWWSFCDKIADMTNKEFLKWLKNEMQVPVKEGEISI